MKNDDDECFKWCVTRALNPVSANAERITKILRKQSKELNWDGIKFPLDPLKIDCFEKQNKSLGVNVFGYYIKCDFDDNYSKLVEYTATSEDEDVAQKFVDMLECEIKRIYDQFGTSKKMIFGDKELREFERSTECWICGGGFKKDDIKVRDHCHYTGKYRGAAHNDCNLKCCKPKFIPVIFHNLSGYDAHLFVKNLGVGEGEINSIPLNEETYISFTKKITVDTYHDDEGEEKYLTRELRFIDSLRFMSSSLDNLVSNLSSAPQSFKSTRTVYSGEQFELPLSKGVYPYEYMDFLDKLNETQLPPKEVFFSKLTGESISEKDYEHAQKVWSKFEMKTLRDYHNLYNKSDVLQFCDVFENFRDVCKKNYDLDPAWYYTAPGLSWDALLKITSAKLELFTDIDMLLMIEHGIRGGISPISNRYGKAYNIYMGEEYDDSKPSKYITYLDANNLYGWAMCKKMPTHGFKWMNKNELVNWRTESCILEVDLEYPKGCMTFIMTTLLLRRG